MAWGVLLGSLVVRALCRAKQVAEEAGCLCKTYDVMVVQRYRFPKGSSCIPLYCHRNVRVCCMGYQILIYCSALAHIVRHVHPTGMERQTVRSLKQQVQHMPSFSKHAVMYVTPDKVVGLPPSVDGNYEPCTFRARGRCQA